MIQKIPKKYRTSPTPERFGASLFPQSANCRAPRKNAEFYIRQPSNDRRVAIVTHHQGAPSIIIIRYTNSFALDPIGGGAATVGTKDFLSFAFAFRTIRGVHGWLCLRDRWRCRGSREARHCSGARRWSSQRESAQAAGVVKAPSRIGTTRIIRTGVTGTADGGHRF